MKKLRRSLAVVGDMVALGAASLAIASPASAIEGGFEAPSAGTDMAQIWYSGPDGTQNEFFCSGVVTNRHKVLTASHCFWKDSNISHYYVRVGSTALGKGERSALQRKETRGELAVLDTISTLDTKGAPYAELAPNEKVPLRKNLESYGWGKTCSNCDNKGSPVLKGAHTKVNDNDDSLRVYNEPSNPAAYRVRGLNGAKIRPGDSGGPSGYFEDGVRIVTGIAWRVDDDDAYMAATYDRVGCIPSANCGNTWLQEHARMKQHTKAAEPRGGGARSGMEQQVMRPWTHGELRKRDPRSGARAEVDENHDDSGSGAARATGE